MHNPFETGERQAFRDMVRDFVAREIRPHADAWDEAGEVPWELHRKAGALGLFGFGIDERYGGLGFDDAFMRAVYAEEMSQCGATGVPAVPFRSGPFTHWAAKKSGSGCCQPC